MPWTPYEPPPPGVDPIEWMMAQPQAYHPTQHWAMRRFDEQFWDVAAPMSDAAVMDRIRHAVPNPEAWSVDYLANVDPLLRGPLATLVTGNIPTQDGVNRIGQANEQLNPYEAYNALNSQEFEDLIRAQAGRKAWQQIADSGDLAMIEAMLRGAEGEELDDIAWDFYARGLEEALFGAAPSVTRALGEIDSLTRRFDGRPYTGGEYMPGVPEAGAVGAPGGAATDTASFQGTAVDPNAPAIPFEMGLVPTGRIVDGPDKMEIDPERTGFQRKIILDGQEYLLSDAVGTPDDPSRSWAYQQALRRVAERQDYENWNKAWEAQLEAERKPFEGDEKKEEKRSSRPSWQKRWGGVLAGADLGPVADAVGSALGAVGRFAVGSDGEMAGWQRLVFGDKHPMSRRPPSQDEDRSDDRGRVVAQTSPAPRPRPLPQRTFNPDWATVQQMIYNQLRASQGWR